MLTTGRECELVYAAAFGADYPSVEGVPGHLCLAGVYRVAVSLLEGLVVGLRRAAQHLLVVQVELPARVRHKEQVGGVGHPSDTRHFCLVY